MKKSKAFGSHALRNSGRRRKKRPKAGEKAGRSAKADKKIIWALCVAAAAAVIVLVSVLLIRSDNSDYNAYMTQAAELYGKGDYDSALSVLRKAEAIDSRDECLLLMADCYEAQNNIEKAIETLGRLSDHGRKNSVRRIISLKERRDELTQTEKLTVAGKSYCPDEKILSLESMGLGSEIFQEISPLNRLEKLSLADNSIDDLSSIPPLLALMSLDLRDNNIEDISPLISLRGLKSLNLDNNPVKELSALTKLKNLSSLSIMGISITPAQLEELSLAMPNCAIFSGTRPEEAATISIGGLSFPSDVQDLNLSGKDIEDISVLSNCTELVNLDISSNKITNLCALMNLRGLKKLNISDNLIGDLRPLMGMASLESVSASGNRVTSTAAVGSMTELLSLELSNNPIGDFSGLNKLKKLQTLELKNTGLTDEGLSSIEGLSALTRLNIEENPELSGEAVDALQQSLFSCRIDHSPLTYAVDVCGHVIKGNATELSICDAGISDISALGNLRFLENVSLSGNNISNIYIFQYTDSRLHIKYLNLSDNAIEDITPIAGLENLEGLNLSNNKINSILPLMALKNLKILRIGGNKLTDEQIQTLRDTLVNCEIIS